LTMQQDCLATAAVYEGRGGAFGPLALGVLRAGPSLRKLRLAHVDLTRHPADEAAPPHKEASPLAAALPAAPRTCNGWDKLRGSLRGATRREGVAAVAAAAVGAANVKSLGERLSEGQRLSEALRGHSTRRRSDGVPQPPAGEAPRRNTGHLFITLPHECTAAAMFAPDGSLLPPSQQRIDGEESAAVYQLSNTRRSTHTVSDLCDALRCDSGLEQADLRDTRLGDAGCRPVVRLISDRRGPSGLTRLELGDNGLTDASTLELSRALRRNSTLLHLGLEASSADASLSLPCPVLSNPRLDPASNPHPRAIVSARAGRGISRPRCSCRLRSLRSALPGTVSAPKALLRSQRSS